MIQLCSNDDPPVSFTVPRKAVELSKTIKTMLEDLEGFDMEQTPIPLPNVDGPTLELIVKWVEQHQDDPPPVEKPRVEDDDSDDSDADDDQEPEVVIPEWDKKFLPTDDEQKNQLFKLLNAANYLEIKPLLDIGCKYVADKISGQTVEWVRDYLNMENDYTPEEEAKLKEEIAWAEGL
uniref:Skp1-related protein n=1 Tax=Plectus sambesii TaxID=2011161 RepID=A0A914XQH1_9BILA